MKSALQIWYFQKKILPLHPQTCAEGCLTSLAEGSRHIKKAFISACFGTTKSGKFHIPETRER